MLVGRVASVNVGLPRPLVVRGKEVPSGIFKTPRRGPQRLEVGGFAGDARVERRKYGEEHHAVHVYPLEHFAYWHERYGRGPYDAGTFGENLTVEGATEKQVRIGDVVECGSALLEISQPRIPCRKLAARMGIPHFSTAFLESLRVGYYLRVTRPGLVEEGDAFRVVDSDPDSPTVADFVRVSQLDYWDERGLASLVRARGLAPHWHEVIEDKLARAREATDRGSWFGTRTLRVVRRASRKDTVFLWLECQQGHSLPPHRSGQSVTLVIVAGEHRRSRRTFPLVDEPTAPGPRRYRVAVQRGPEEVELFACLREGDRVGCLAPQ